MMNKTLQGVVLTGLALGAAPAYTQDQQALHFPPSTEAEAIGQPSGNRVTAPQPVRPVVAPQQPVQSQPAQPSTRVQPQGYSYPTAVAQARPVTPYPYNPQVAMPYGYGNNYAYAYPYAPQQAYNPYSAWRPYAYGATPYAARPYPGPARPAMPLQQRKKEVKPWGDTRYIWPDFYTEFTGDLWDKMINAPYDMGYMPGGWRFPSFSSPDPVTVSDAIANQVPPFAEEAGNMIPYDDVGNMSPF